MSSVVQPIPQSSLTCPECGGAPRETNDYIVCAGCGLVLGNRVQESDPLRLQEQASQRSLAPDKGSLIPYVTKKSGLTSEQAENIAHLRKTQDHLMPHRVFQMRWINALSRIQTRVQITETVRQRTLWIFEHMAPGWGQRDRTPFLLACLITAARELNHPVSFNRVQEFLRLDGHRRSKKFNKALLYLQEHMKERSSCLPATAHLPRTISSLANNKRVVQDLTAKSLKPQGYLSMIEREARVLLDSTESLKSVSHSPSVLAASACYVVDQSVNGAGVITSEDFEEIHSHTIIMCARLWLSIPNGRVTVACAILKLVAAISQSPRTSLSEVAGSTRISLPILKCALARLVDAGVVDDCGNNVLTFCPQESPEALRTIDIMAHANDWNDAVRVLFMNYLEKRFKTTNRDLIHLSRVRVEIRNRLPFLQVSEYRNILREVIDDLCINGILRLVEGDVYRFSL